MQFVNDDMDELFRRAAENYPLDTASSKNWNKVLHILNENEPAAPERPQRKRGYWRFSLLLLLLPAYLVCNQMAGDRHSGQPSSGQNGHDGAIRDVSALQPSASAKPRQKTGTAGTVASETQRGEASFYSLAPIPVEAAEAASGLSDMATTKNTARPATKESSNTGYKNISNGITEDLAGGTAGSAQEAGGSDAAFRSVFTARIAGPDRNLPAALSLVPTRRNIVSGPVSTPPASMPAKRFYAGLMVGTEYTTIRFQKADDAGFDYGLLAGYELGRRWSIEAAAFMTRKSYYSDGKYVKSDRVYRPPNAELTDVTGTCRMLDLSLGARYQFASGRSSTWFAAGGLSSYFMKNEDYSYSYFYRQLGYRYIHEESYKNESRNILSIANLSIGYTHKLGKLGQLRIEPYLKIPLGGIGYGELPMLSSGVRAGFVRKLF